MLHSPIERELIDKVLEGKDVLDAGTEMGLPIDAVLALYRHALSVFPSIPVPDARQKVLSPDTLTSRELQILHLLADGKRNIDIAHSLSVSVNTVRAHIRNIVYKMGCSNRVEAVARATKHGLLTKIGA